MNSPLAAFAADPSLALRNGSGPSAILQATTAARDYLATLALDGDIHAMVRLRDEAAAISGYAASRRPQGRAAELAAAEIGRRTEREIGLAIRRGQARGTIARRHQHIGNQHTGPGELPIPRVTDFVTKAELAGNNHTGIYGLTDDITTEQFEEAIRQAREERNLSRANVRRKLDSVPVAGDWVPSAFDHSSAAAARRREIISGLAAEGYSSRQIGEQIGVLDGTVRRLARAEGIEITADRTMRRTRHHDGSHIVEETTHILDGAIMSLQLVNPGELDRERARDWAASLTNSAREIIRFTKAMKEATP